MGLTGRLGGVKVRPLEIENAVLGEGWATNGGDTPIATLSTSNLTPATLTSKVMRSSTKGTDLVVDFKKPAVDDPIEYVEVDTFAFRDAATTTAIKTALDDRGVKTTVKTTALPLDTMVGSAVNVARLSLTPTGDRWSLDNVDSLKVVINSKAGG
ncbi:hypothetical protein D3C71_1759870 [compost metagenome]